MQASQRNAGSILVGWYVWVVTIYLGMVLLDITYANFAPSAAGAFSEVADLLLLGAFVVAISALAAIAAGWNIKAARNLLIASLLVNLLELFIPAFFYGLLNNTAGAAFGPWLRILPVGAASVLAFAGMHRYYRQN